MNTGNRILWTIVGLVLTGLGVVGLLINLGRMPRTDRHQVVLWPELLRQWREWHTWMLVGVVALGLLLVLLGLLLLRGQLRRRSGASMRDLRMTSPSDMGQTVVGARVMVKGLEHDLANQPGISNAAAHLGGGSDDPRLRLWLTVEPGTNLDPIRRLVRLALSRFTTTTSLRPADVFVDARIARLRGSRLTPVR